MAQHAQKVLQQGHVGHRRSVPELGKRHLRGIGGQAGHGVDALSQTIDGPVHAQGGKAQRAVAEHHGAGSPAERPGVDLLHEAQPFRAAGGPGQGTHVAAVVAQAIVQWVVLEDEEGVFGRVAREINDDLRHTFEHAGEGRVAPHLGVGVQLQGHEVEGNMSAQQTPRHLKAVLAPAPACQVAGDKTEKFTADAIGSMGPVAVEEGPEQHITHMVPGGHEHAARHGVGRVGRRQFRIFQFPGARPHSLRAARQGGIGVDAALFQRDVAGPQIPFLKHPDAGIALAGQPHGLAVQGAPVAHEDEVRHADPLHEAGDPLRPLVGMTAPAMRIVPRPVEHVAPAEVDAVRRAARAGEGLAQLAEEGAQRPLQEEEGAPFSGHRPPPFAGPRAGIRRPRPQRRANPRRYAWPR